ncbi:uncharacterized protein LOC130736645 [Lotus japonicus]|uniref:uncharacterized protein LOC130736645 n=1 Tax=Lotus japonicus TaxID=34305 RepID=UPI002586F606|nr:uncharacterized protein LOC130736645 [Lotus japonicus]
MRILTYNVRGLGNSVKWRIIREMITKEEVNFACFQETKLEAIDTWLCRALWGDDSFEWTFTPAVNRGGGLLCLWLRGTFNLIRSYLGSGFICLQGVWGDGNLPYAIVNFYGSCTLQEKILQWGELTALRARLLSHLWCIVGDFNSVRSPEERIGISSGPDSSRRDTDEFNGFINDMELLDLPLVGRKFTWFRPNGHAMSRLDRALVSSEWMEAWPNCFLHVQRRDVSDHCPLILKVSNHNWGPKPFRTINGWLQDPRFRDYVEKEWNNLQFQGWGAFILKEKLKDLKTRLKSWNTEVFGNLTTQKNLLASKLEELDRKADEEGLLEEEIRTRKNTQADFWKVARLNEPLLHQKARQRWVKEGDSNSKYFHSLVRWKRRKNAIVGLNVDGVWYEEPTTVKLKVKEYFERKFSKDDVVAPRLDGVNFNQLSSADNAFLTTPFDLEEIKKAVWDCEGDKSPGPDDYNFHFIKSF